MRGCIHLDKHTSRGPPPLYCRLHAYFRATGCLNLRGAIPILVARVLVSQIIYMYRESAVLLPRKAFKTPRVWPLSTGYRWWIVA